MWTAQKRVEALQILAKISIHVAVIDLRLEREGDPKDFSGLHLAAEIDEKIAKIILTAHGDSPADAILQALNHDERGKALAYQFVYKHEGPEKWLEVIRAALKHKVHYNPDLKITMETGLSWRVLAEMLKGSKSKSEDEKRVVEQELQDLVHKLFDRAQGVRLLRIDPGHGGCGVVLAEPIFDGPGAEVVIKFGPRSSIDREFDNYNDFVMPYAPNRASQIRGEAVSTKNLGAIKYGFVGGSPLHLRDFRRFYLEGDVDLEAIYAVVNDLFEKSCEKWYGGRRPVRSAQEIKPLDTWYREQLSLDQEHTAELWAVFARLLQAPNQFSSHFQQKGKERLRIVLGRDAVVLPNPLHWALEQKASQKKSDFFSIPSLLAITHGDLNATNILVDKDRKTWLIDFFKTGYGPVLRDLAELETVIKFELIQTDSLVDRWELERALLEPTAFSQPITFESRSHSSELQKVIHAIQQLREIARSLSNTDDMFEYYTGLLFYALKGIEGFSSKDDGVHCCHVSQYHALLSAAILCDKLNSLSSSPTSAKSVFIAHPYSEEWINRRYIEFRDSLSKSHGIQLRHPFDVEGGPLWDDITVMIRSTNAGLYELTEANVNVYLELGYAIGIRRPFFILYDSKRTEARRLPRVLQSEKCISYRSDAELYERIRKILVEKPIGKHLFFRKKNFAATLKGIAVASNTCLLVIANTDHLLQDIAPVLRDTLIGAGWDVCELESVHRRQFRDLYQKLSGYKLVVGCLASGSEAAAYPLVNPELALTTGMALGIGSNSNRKLILLQEQPCSIPSDLTGLVEVFSGKEEARKDLLKELSDFNPVSP